MKCREATLAGRRRGGSFNLRIDSSGSLDEPPRPRQTRCLRAIFLDGAATPPLPRRGVFASYRFVLNSSTSGALKLGDRRVLIDRPRAPPACLGPTLPMIEALRQGFHRQGDGEQLVSMIKSAIRGRCRMIRSVFIKTFLVAWVAVAQRISGEIRLQVTDVTGSTLQASGSIVGRSTGV